MYLPSLCTFLAVFNPVFGNAFAAAVPETQNIICHGTECYPKIFEPTDNFQVVHEDQDIPPGLHVRLNLESGLKEAKLYDGHDDESLNAVEVFTDDAGDSVPEPVALPRELGQEAQKVLKPNPNNDQGAIRPPSPNSPDGVAFESYRSVIAKSSTTEPNAETLLPALENLEDLSHDIYWGLNLAKDRDSVRKLNVFLSSASIDTQIKSAAALLLGTAIQNNPAALTAALSHFYNDEYPSGPLETVMMALIHEQLPQLAIRLVYLLTELCQDPKQLAKLIRADGLDLLRVLFNASQASLDANDRLRQKISNFVLDHFLHEDALDGLTKLRDVGKSTAKSGMDKPKPAIEDSWVIIDESEAQETPEAKAQNIAAALHPWCLAFKQSLANWKNSNGKGEREAAMEHVIEADQALQKKLKSYGCSCADKRACNP